MGASSNPHATSISATTTPEAITQIKKNREHAKSKISRTLIQLCFLPLLLVFVLEMLGSNALLCLIILTVVHFLHLCACFTCSSYMPQLLPTIVRMSSFPSHCRITIWWVNAVISVFYSWFFVHCFSVWHLHQWPRIVHVYFLTPVLVLHYDWPFSRYCYSSTLVIWTMSLTQNIYHKKEAVATELPVDLDIWNLFCLPPVTWPKCMMRVQ